MKKYIAIVIGIILVGAVLYATGVFDGEMEEPIISNTVDGSFKHTFKITYVDGTSETITSDSVLAKILHNDAEVTSVAPYLYIKPMNPSELDYAIISITFPNTFYWTWNIECVGGDLYDTLEYWERDVYRPLYIGYLTSPDDSETINSHGSYTFDMDSDFQEVGHHEFLASAIDNLVGVTALGLPGIFELRMTYSGTGYFAVQGDATHYKIGRAHV